MKLHQLENSVESCGILSQSTFQIKQSAKAFKILSSSLYKNKILAIIRELSCNAYDAHIDNGNSDIPFEIHMPISIEPNFRIRDFGKGLSHDDIMSMYTTYFESTKTNSNDSVGALGLGSKSPFSYTNAFTVNSYFNNVKRSYSAFINDEGVPNIVMLLEIPTSEESGLEIQFPVHDTDKQTFSYNAHSVFQYFPVKPKMLTGPELFTAEELPLYSNDNWKLFSTITRIRAIHGVVSYPISVAAIPNFPSRLKYLLNLGIEISFDIGSLDVAPSREELSYDKETCSIIIQQLNKIHKYFHAFFQSKIKDSPNLWIAQCEYNKLWDSSIITEKLLKNSDTYYYYDNIEISNKYKKSLDNFSESIRVFGENMRGQRTKSMSMVSDWSVIIDYTTGIVFNDVKSNYLKKIKRLQNDKGYHRIYEFEYVDQSSVDSIINELGNPEYVMLSDVVINKTKSDVVYNVLEFHDGTWYSEPHNITDLKELKNVYYIEFHGLDPIYDIDYVADKCQQIIKKAKALNVINKDIKIVGLNKSTIRHVNIDNCVHIIDHIRDRLLSYTDMLEIYDQFTSHSVPSNSGYLYLARHRLLENNSVLDPDFNKILQSYIERDELYSIDGFPYFEYLYKVLNPGVNTATMCNMIYDRYPLLRRLPYTSAHNDISDFKDFEDYMNIVYKSLN